MIVSSVYLGFNKKKEFHLLQIGLQNDRLNKISSNLKLKSYNLHSLTNVLEDLSSQRKSFFIKGDYTDNSSKTGSQINLTNAPKYYTYYLDLVMLLHKCLYDKKCFVEKNKTPQDIPLLNDIKNLSNSKYKYIIYFGYKNKKDKNVNKQPTLISIFQLKNNFIFTRKTKRTLLFVKTKDTFGSSNLPSFKIMSNNDLFQLPLDKKDNIANFYKKQTDNKFKLKVYYPLKFDDMFDTRRIKKEYADKTFKRFNNKDNPLVLTQNKIHVSFVKSQRNLSSVKSQKDLTDDTKNIERKVSQYKDLTDSMATFTGNNNSTIKRIKGYKLRNVLKQLRKDVKNKNISCDFGMKNIPIMKKFTSKNEKNVYVLLITMNSISLFCSLLRNKVIERLLTSKVSH